MARTVQLDYNTSVTTQMHVWSCPVCGIVYGIPVAFAKECRENGNSYYCPAGDRLSWQETEADRQRKRAERAEEDRDYWQREEKKERKRAEKLKREKAAVKGQLTKTKNRVAKGVCPCCNRHFVNVQKHMQTKHPEYVEGKEKADG